MFNHRRTSGEHVSPERHRGRAWPRPACEGATREARHWRPPQSPGARCLHACSIYCRRSPAGNVPPSEDQDFAEVGNVREAQISNSRRLTHDAGTCQGSPSVNPGCERAAILAGSLSGRRTRQALSAVSWPGDLRRRHGEIPQGAGAAHTASSAMLLRCRCSKLLEWTLSGPLRLMQPTSEATFYAVRRTSLLATFRARLTSPLSWCCSLRR